MKMLWKRERPRDMTHLMDFSLPYSKPYSRVKNVDIPLMDSNRNQPRNTNHQGSQQLVDFFFSVLTGGGLDRAKTTHQLNQCRRRAFADICTRLQS